MLELTIRSTQAQQLIDITDRLRELEPFDPCDALLIYVPHTTAGVLVNEHADPDVARDVLTALDHIAPPTGPYRHSEGNAAAHIKAVLVGTSQMVPVVDGHLALGTWQGVFLAEFDGPRSRRLVLTPISSREP